jgi:UDP-N-acetylmuramoyl-tripeptide--D-alanyl-D-alanine ligase
VLDPATLALKGNGHTAAGLAPATGLSFHSGRVRPGDAFFALPGSAAHGIVYAEAALAAGAAFVVSDRPHPRGVTVTDPAKLLLKLGAEARQKLTGVVVGVTGSAGKTSVKTLLATGLNAAASPGNFNTPFALAQVLVERVIAGATGQNDRLVLELGIDHPGEMDVLLRLAQPTHGVVTLIAPSHLAGLGSVAEVATEKLKLVSAARHAFVSAQAATFLNKTHLDQTQRSKVTTYGLEEDDLGDSDPRNNDVVGRLEDITPSGQTFHALGVSVRLPFVGAALAENALAVLAVAASLGDDLNETAERLSRTVLEPGRLQVHRLGPLTLIDDSYNSNPASAAAALEALTHFPRPHSAVLGDMLELGADSARYHRALGERTLDLEHVIAIGPEMRALTEGNPDAHHVETFDISLLLPLLPEHGTLLVKGSRGMRLERLVHALLEKCAEAVKA